MPNEQLAASPVSLFFSFKGRINRARFWIGTVPFVMGVVVQSGRVAPGDPIGVSMPPEPHRALQRV